MLSKLTSSILSFAVLWRAKKERVKYHFALKVRGALPALLDGSLIKTIVNWLDFTDEQAQDLDWTDGYWHMPRFPYGAVEDDWIVSPGRNSGD